MHHGGADEIGEIGEERAGETANRAGDDKAGEPVAKCWKADSAHAAVVGSRSLNCERPKRELTRRQIK